MSKLNLFYGSLFDAQTDAIVIPRSTVGTMSRSFESGLSVIAPQIMRNGLEYRALGQTDFIPLSQPPRVNETKFISAVIFATCVDNNFSSYDAIELCVNQIARFSHEYPDLKSIGVPLLGTGAGALEAMQIYSLLSKVFIEKGHSNCTFTICIHAEDEYNKILKVYASPLSKSASGHSEGLNYYLAGTQWNGESDQSVRFIQDGIWENGYEDKYVDLVKDVNINDFILLKSTFVKRAKSMLSVRAVGVVTENPKDGRLLKVDWIVREMYEEFEGLGYYRNTIARIRRKDLDIILDRLYANNSYRNSIRRPSVEVQRRDWIAGITSDNENGIDLLDISRDVMAFAKIMADKNFIPPLAVALFGKWGTGKSFFMQQLKSTIQSLTNSNDGGNYCTGVAHIHFNAWSYLDANLWASIVSQIFEGLDNYIKNDNASEKVKRELQKALTQQLNITNEELAVIDLQKKEVQAHIEVLTDEKKKLSEQIEKSIADIRLGGLKSIWSAVDAEFKIDKALNDVLEANQSFVKSRSQLETIIPAQYLRNPDEAFKQVKKASSFLRAFFNSKNLKYNIIIVCFIIAAIFGVPPLLRVTVGWLKNVDLRLPQVYVSAIVLLAPLVDRLRTTYKAWRPFVASMWKIKEDYQKAIKEAVSANEQREKAIKLEVDKSSVELAALDSKLQQAHSVIGELEFKRKHAMATEALYSFIERRCKSDDYRKHLGIVSIIQKDFQTLSTLFVDHHGESTSDAFKNKLERPLQRIILYIDDLDRCPEDRVVEVLEAVHLLMAFPLFIVVVGVDPRWVKNALTKRHYLQFTGRFDGELLDGTKKVEAGDYLEKIFQVPFHLKDADGSGIERMVTTLTARQLYQEKRSPLNKAENVDMEEDVAVANVREMESQFAVPLTDPLLNTKQLELTGDEIELMAKMAQIVGSNPRAVKRFVNIYQIVRAYAGVDYDAQKIDFQIQMFLIALSMHKFKKLYSDLIIKDDESVVDAQILKEYLHSQSTNENADLADLKVALSVILNRSELFEHILQIPIGRLVKSNYFVKRFTFSEVE